jgi:hypothetical protein
MLDILLFVAATIHDFRMDSLYLDTHLALCASDSTYNRDPNRGLEASLHGSVYKAYNKADRR